MWSSSCRFVDDPRIDPAMFRYDADQLRLSHAIENFHWQVREDGQVDCVLAGWAFVRKVDLTHHKATDERRPAQPPDRRGPHVRL